MCIDRIVVFERAWMDVEHVGVWLIDETSISLTINERCHVVASAQFNHPLHVHDRHSPFGRAQHLLASRPVHMYGCHV
jgi:hypothetical protein